MTSIAELKDKKITVMGLGLHGGGTATARFLAQAGASVTVTDLRDSRTLAPSMERLKAYPIRFVLGHHEERDFINADIVVKNPAVPASSPFLAHAKQIESDISLFLRFSQAPLLAVTGSKGKSTTASAIHAGLLEQYPAARLGGNITVSPLSFLHELSDHGKSPVVLELSSWQLADLRGKGLLRPAVSVLTNLMADHQDRYDSMESYLDDKKNIFREQRPDQYCILNADDKWIRDLGEETAAKTVPVTAKGQPEPASGAWLTPEGGFIRGSAGTEQLLPADLSLPGPHNRNNLLFAATALYLYGIPADTIRRRLQAFSGIPHRLELCRTHRGVRFYNDSAATLPDAVAVALESFSEPLHLIMGGTDKELDFTVLEHALRRAASIQLLEGSGTAKLLPLLNRWGYPYQGPFSSLRAALDAALLGAKNGAIILLSPGCASFGMFKNEFDRGDQFRKLVAELD